MTFLMSSRSLAFILSCYHVLLDVPRCVARGLGCDECKFISQFNISTKEQAEAQSYPLQYLNHMGKSIAC
jgi:hypothetical protein